jgi:copper chaperone CopZ
MSSVTLKVTGMHCSHCRAKVEQALQKVPGVFGASVDLDGGTAEVDFDGQKAAPDAMVAAVKSVGYGAEVGQ